jgi:hypothetical protein
MFDSVFLYNQPITIPNSVVDCRYMFNGCTNMRCNIYIDNKNLNNKNMAGFIKNHPNNKRINIFCNNIQVLNRTDTDSIIEQAITWSSISNGYYNRSFNIYIYSNYISST